MNYKTLFTGIIFAIMNSLVFGDVCKEINDFCEKDIRYCKIDDNGKVTVSFTNYDMDEECFEKISTYDSITSLTYLEYGPNPAFNATFNMFPSAMNNFTNLVELNYAYSAYRGIGGLTIPEGELKLPKSLKYLTIYSIILSQSNIEEIATSSNLEKLNMIFLKENNTINYDPLKNLKKLSSLDLKCDDYLDFEDLPEVVYSNAEIFDHLSISRHGLTNISDRFSSLKNLTYLGLNDNFITSILNKLNGLNKLEYIDLSYNKINEEIPEFMNDFENLEYINLSGNINITGKTLTNDKLESCYYDEKYDLCLAKKMECFSLTSDYYNYKDCQSNNDDNDNIPLSTDGQCGKDHGKCPNSQCCSKYGWCGSTDIHCAASNGCQSKFGRCDSNDDNNNDNNDNNDDTIPLSTDGQCGKDHGKCPNSQCCSKYGWCGSTSSHCFISRGCQSEFGKCTENSTPTPTTTSTDTTTPALLDDLPISTNGQCNSKDGKCQSGLCCSKYGWCGTGEKYCGVGCQKQFGNCN